MRRGDISKTDAGGVILSISDFDGLPFQVNLSQEGDFVTIGSLTVQSIAKNPSQPSSSLMNVELQSIEYTYQREDTGTRVLPKLVNSIFSVVPVDGTVEITNEPFLTLTQLDAQLFAISPSRARHRNE
ncbi:MAG: hypothetical protein R2862_00250 [Thermoanaerobaculia bacterium]